MPESIVFRSSEDSFEQARISGHRLKSISSSDAAGLDYISSPRFGQDFRIHKTMVHNSVAPVTAIPIIYIRTPLTHERPSYNSSQSNISAAALSHYEHVERSLSQLSQDPEGQRRVEEGAVSSALAVVAELKKRDIAPPELSWHGGDAIVMLWALGDTTYAITVTDGEVGYVVRRNRKALKIADSITLRTFQLEDLR